MGPRLLVVALARTGRWTARKFPVVDAAGASAWPARWTRERIEQRRLELGEFRFRRQYLCEEVDDSERRFKREWLRRGLQRGRGWGPFPGLDTTTLPPGSRTFSGVDLAVSREAGSDLSAIATIAVFPTNGDRLLVNVESGRWSAPEILRRVVDAHERYSSTLIVEANAAQDYLRQMLLAEHPGLPVIAHTTTAASKFDAVWGYEAIAVEFERARWIGAGDGGRRAGGRGDTAAAASSTPDPIRRRTSADSPPRAGSGERTAHGGALQAATAYGKRPYNWR